MQFQKGNTLQPIARVPSQQRQKLDMQTRNTHTLLDKDIETRSDPGDGEEGGKGVTVQMAPILKMAHKESRSPDLPPGGKLAHRGRGSSAEGEETYFNKLDVKEAGDPIEHVGEDTSMKKKSNLKGPRSPEKSESKNIIERSISPQRMAAHKQVGGRILQENEIKLAQVLEENQSLEKLYN